MNQIVFSICRQNGTTNQLAINTHFYQQQFANFIKHNKISHQEAIKISTAIQQKIKQLIQDIKNQDKMQQQNIKKIQPSPSFYSIQNQHQQSSPQIKTKKKYMLLQHYHNQQQPTSNYSYDYSDRRYNYPTKNWENKKIGDKNPKQQKQDQQFQEYRKKKYYKPGSQTIFNSLHEKTTISFQKKKQPQVNFQQQQYLQYLKIKQQVKKKQKRISQKNKQIKGSKCVYQETVAENLKKIEDNKIKEKTIRQRMKKEGNKQQVKVSPSSRSCYACDSPQKSPPSPISTIKQKVNKEQRVTAKKKNHCIESVLTDTWKQFNNKKKLLNLK